MDQQNNLLIGIVSAQHKERYEVISSDRHFIAQIKGSLLYHAKNCEDYPAVGDQVTINPVSNELAIIEEMMPRRTVLRKKAGDKSTIQVIAANVDVAFIVQAVGRDYNLNRFERFIVLAKDGNIRPVMILNKIDLISEADLDRKITEIKSRFKDVEVVTTSIVNKQGLGELKNFIQKDQIYCFLGSSGVGKSTLINYLLEDEIIKTKEIGEKTQRGKHTTTHRELYFLKNGGILIDNPGIREVGILDSGTAINNVFSQINSLSKTCRFNNCSHINEPGCAVLNSLKTGEIPEDEYRNYLKLKKESDYYAMTEFEKRNKDRKFGKFVKKVLKELDGN